MAIRFVDRDAGDGKAEAEKPAPARAAARHEPPSPGEPDTDPASAAHVATLPGLPHAKPEPKQKGRKKPMGTADAAKPLDGAAAPAAVAPGSDGAEAEALLPGLQVHAKPTPKPRGRKKAFG